MKRLLLLLPIVLLTCGAGKRELVSYICEYKNDENTAGQMIADFKEDWGEANELYVPWIFDKRSGENYIYKRLEDSFHHAKAEVSKEYENEIYVYDTSIKNGVFRVITSTYEISNSSNPTSGLDIQDDSPSLEKVPKELWAHKLLFPFALTYKAIFELNMNTMSETFTALYGSDEKASTDECMFISLPENSKIEWKE